MRDRAVLLAKGESGGNNAQAVHQVSTPLRTGERQPDDAFFKELNDSVQAVLDKPRP